MHTTYLTRVHTMRACGKPAYARLRRLVEGSLRRALADAQALPHVCRRCSCRCRRASGRGHIQHCITCAILVKLRMPRARSGWNTLRVNPFICRRDLPPAIPTPRSGPESVRLHRLVGHNPCKSGSKANWDLKGWMAHIFVVLSKRAGA